MEAVSNKRELVAWCAPLITYCFLLSSPPHLPAAAHPATPAHYASTPDAARPAQSPPVARVRSGAHAWPDAESAAPPSSPPRCQTERYRYRYFADLSPGSGGVP